MKTKKSVQGSALSPACLPDHLLLGSGGSRTILSSAGSLAAMYLAGIGPLHFQTIGGISGGSITALLFSAGIPVSTIVRLAVELDFAGMMDRAGSQGSFIRYLLLDEYFPFRFPEKGILDTTRLGEFLAELVPSWPEKFWTMSVSESSIIVFDREGVREMTYGGEQMPLVSAPVPPSLAVRASCTVPGLMIPPAFQGRLLYDGAYTPYGRCPVQIPLSMLAIEPCQVLAVDAGAASSPCKLLKRRLFGAALSSPGWLWKNLEPVFPEGLHLVQPDLGKLQPLKFKLSEPVKWQAVLSGFESMLVCLQGLDLIETSRFWQVRALIDEVLSEKDDLVRCSLIVETFRSLALY